MSVALDIELLDDNSGHKRCEPMACPRFEQIIAFEKKAGPAILKGDWLPIPVKS